ncbi:MAG: transketolase [Chloroflexi bacterium]|nr:transketolase [Chloroflexota bacterium]
MEKNKLIEEIRDKTELMRRDCIEMGFAAGSQGAHFGPALSCVDIVATLFFSVMHHDPNNPDMPERDRFVMSKGHACMAYYAALIESGYIPKEMIPQFKGNNSILCGHPSMNMHYGIEVSTGSLGSGLPIACGMAMAAKYKNEKHKVFCVVGDGECNEGIIWEAAFNAAKYKLDNLIVVVDINDFQLSGMTAEVMPINLDALWKAAGWDVSYIDNGNDVEEVLQTLGEVKKSEGENPKVILTKTVKGKGISFMENNLAFHAAPINEEQYKQAIVDLNRAEASR